MTSTYKPLTEISKAIRTELKQTFPGYKFSVRIDNSVIMVRLMSAPESPFVGTALIGPHYEQFPEHHDGQHVELNRYGIKQDHRGRWISGCVQLTETAAKIFQQVTEIALRDHWDESRIEVDYHCTNFYLDLGVGKWNKSFVTK